MENGCLNWQVFGVYAKITKMKTLNQNPFFNINALEKYSNPYRLNIIFIAINYILNKLYKNEPYML